MKTPSFKVEYRKQNFGSYPCLHATVEKVRELQRQNVISGRGIPSETRPGGACTEIFPKRTASLGIVCR
jgi:hypothetical protein